METLICIEYVLRAGYIIFLVVRECFLGVGKGKLSIYEYKLEKVIKITFSAEVWENIIFRKHWA